MGAQALLAVLALAPVASAQDPELDNLRAELSRPGPEAQDVRHSAALALMDTANPAAHGVLHARLLDDQDPDDVRGMVLEQLESRLRNDRDKVFGLQSESRPALHQSYVPALSHVMGVASLEAQARACYLRLDPQARFAGIEAMIGEGQVLAGIRAARESRLPRAGKILAGLLADPKHAGAAGAALSGLTFHTELFESEAAFDVWYGENQHLTYTDLAERAARDAQGHLESVREQHQVVVLKARAELAESLCQAAPIDWKRLEELCDPGSPEQSLACLTVVRQRMATRLHEGNGARDRRKFHTALVDALDQPVSAVAAGLDAARTETLRAALLEVAAYLLRPSDSAEVELREAMTARLRAALAGNNQAMRLAALKGVRRFFSEQNRAAVLGVIDVELARLDALGSEDPASAPARAQAEEVLTAAFTTLDNTVVWPAPAGEDELDVLRNALDAVLERPGIEGIKRQALALARLRDVEGRRLEKLFLCLEGQARSANQAPELRRLAFLYAQDYVAEAELTGRYVQLALDLLVDAEPELRRVAAERLKALPETDNRLREWSRGVLNKARDLLLTELEPAVYKELVKTLAQCAMPPRAEPEDVESVLLALQAAIEDAARDPVRPELQFRLEPLFGELNVVAASPDVATDQWVLAADLLVRHNQRARALDVLTRQRPATVPATDPASLTAWTLPLQTAELRQPPEAMPPEEARGVREVVALLDEHKTDWRTPMFRLIEVEAAAVLGDMDRARSIGEDLLRSNELVPSELDRARLAVAQAQAAAPVGQAGTGPERAVALLVQIAPNTDYSPPAAELLQQIATAHRTADPALALSAVGAMRGLLREDQDGFRDRFLLWAEVTLALEPSSAEQVAAELQRWKMLFTAAECPEHHRVSFDVLLGKVGGGEQGAGSEAGSGSSAGPGGN